MTSEITALRKSENEEYEELAKKLELDWKRYNREGRKLAVLAKNIIEQMNNDGSERKISSVYRRYYGNVSIERLDSGEGDFIYVIYDGSFNSLTEKLKKDVKIGITKKGKITGAKLIIRANIDDIIPFINDFENFFNTLNNNMLAIEIEGGIIREFHKEIVGGDFAAATNYPYNLSILTTTNFINAVGNKDEKSKEFIYDRNTGEIKITENLRGLDSNGRPELEMGRETNYVKDESKNIVKRRIILVGDDRAEVEIPISKGEPQLKGDDLLFVKLVEACLEHTDKMVKKGRKQKNESTERLVVR